MKCVVFLLLVGCALSSADIFGKSCKKNEDCESDECCINYSVITIFGGKCGKLRKEGQNCTPLTRKDQEQEPDMYHFQCPCTGGLRCEATNELKIGEHIIKYRPECVDPNKITTVPKVKPTPTQTETPFPEPTPAA